MHTHTRTYKTCTVTTVMELTQTQADHSFEYTDGPNFDMLI